MLNKQKEHLITNLKFNNMWFVVLTLLVPANADGRCLALSFEGGGSHGAYEIGCLQALIENLPPNEVQWDILTGISIGAFNTGLASQFAKGEEAAMVDLLLSYWLNFNSSSTAYKEWPGGYLEGLTIKSSLLDGSPGNIYYHRYFKSPPKRKASVGTVNLNTGKFTYFNEDIASKDWAQAISASGSPPFYFPPVYFYDSWWVDGGCSINLDVFTAIERCLDIVHDESKVVVDMLYDDYVQKLAPETEFNSLEIFNRVKQIRGVDNGDWYYYNAKLAYPKVNFRYVLKPSQTLPGGALPLDFDKPAIEWEIELGRNDTLKVLNQGHAAYKWNPLQRINSQVFYAHN